MVRGTGLAAPRHAGSFRTRDRTGVPRIAKQSVNHWTTGEGRLSILNITRVYMSFPVLNITCVYLSMPNSQSTPSPLSPQDFILGPSDYETDALPTAPRGQTVQDFILKGL